MKVVREESFDQEGAWNCSSCLKTGIPALTTECPECGDPCTPNEDPREKPYLPQNARVLSDPAELAIAKGGKNWTCSKCGQANRKRDTVCSNPDCQDPRDKSDTFWRRTVYSDNGVFTEVPSHYNDLVPNPVKEAERLLDGDTDARELEDSYRPLNELPRTGSSTAEFDDVRRQAKERADDREWLNRLNPAVQLLVMFWRFVVMHWNRLARFHKPIKLGAIGALVVGVIWAIVSTVIYFTATVDGTVTVADRHWERSVEVERFTTLHQEDWSYPADARVLDSRREIRSYETVVIGSRDEVYTVSETVPDGSESYEYACGSTVTDNGNGTFRTTTKYCNGSRPKYRTVQTQKTRQVPITEQRPVYDTKYVYEIDRWVTSRWVSLSDRESERVVWPEVTDLRPGGSLGGRMGEERVGTGRRATYSVDYVDTNGNQVSDNVEEEVWNKIEDGQVVAARYYQRNGELASVDWGSVLTPAS